MPTLAACPTCNRKLRVADDLLGKQVRCPACQTVFPATPPPSPTTSPVQANPGSPLPAPQGTESPSPPVARRRRNLLHADLAPCPGCGEEISATADECPACGALLEDDYRPWEEGGVRRDWESHRGGMIMTLGIISDVCAGLALPLSCCCGFLGIPPSLLGLGLGLTALLMGRSDLRKMEAHVMDPAGRGQTNSGYVCGVIGTTLGGITFLLALALFLFGMASFTMPAMAPPARAPVAPGPAVQPPVPVAQPPVKDFQDKAEDGKDAEKDDDLPRGKQPDNGDGERGKR